MKAKQKKDLTATASAVLLIVVAVMGWHWLETSKRTFWADFWTAAAVFALVAVGGAWIYFSRKYKKDE